MDTLTPNEVIDSIVIGDRTVEIIGYVDSLERPKIVGKIKKYKLVKFTINNDLGRKIQCLAWEGEVDRVAAEIGLNKIIHFDGLTCKKIENQAFNLGNVEFELNINTHTQINVLGEYENTQPEFEIALIKLENVADSVGKIKVRGFIKSQFTSAKSPKQNSSYGIGAITDGNCKIEVRISFFEPLGAGFEKGTHIEVTGIIQNDSVPYLSVSQSSDIKKIDEEIMGISEMINVTKIPRKRAKLE